MVVFAFLLLLLLLLLVVVVVGKRKRNSDFEFMRTPATLKKYWQPASWGLSTDNPEHMS